ncbi:MAG: type II/IV secretion system protein [Elusimicrobia bacterium]|nr:type II/IV secretion system protein [Elusimicrobiota bacterium]
MNKKPLGEMLVEAEILSSQELKVALEAQRQVPAPLGVTVVQLGMATEDEILPILAHQLNRIDVALFPQRRDETPPSSISEAVEQVFCRAVEQEATDIHFEPTSLGVKLRFRIDGILHEVGADKLINAQYVAAVSRIKILCNLDIAERRMPQEGRTSVQVGGREVDLRISILPSRYGESIVVRILQTEIPLGLSNLGLHPEDLETMEKILQRRSGLILVTGPTGCGKTTTLYACLDQLNDSTRKIVTVEDPIEYTMPGAIQMQVNTAIDLTFGRFLRTVLRHDPNIIMVGEIRDKETAEVAIRMALTGHLVLSTLHTNDAASTVTRLLEMGIEPFLVASSLSCAIAQRLVRTICPRCKGKRCVVCLGLGLKGRTGLFECLVVDEEVRKFILKQAAAEEIRQWMKSQGKRSLLQDGLNKVQGGITTQDELNRVIHQDEF